MRTAAEMSWQPLFSPAESRPFRHALERVAEDLASPFAVPPADAADGRPAACDGLADGRAGAALLFVYRHADSGAPRDRANAVRLFNEAIAAVTARPFAPSFHAGWTGVAWAAAHVGGRPGWRDGGDPAAEVDRLVRRAAAEAWPDAPLGLADGLVGLGVYALERLPRGDAAACLQRVVDLLHDRVDDDDAARAHPGPARGLAGAVALLAAAHAAGVPRAALALERAVARLLTCHLTVEGVGHGWEGLPGVAAALLRAGRLARRPEWGRTAETLALEACATPLDRCGVRDHGLARGAAGAAHVLHRLHRATGRPELREGARTWFLRLLDMRHPRGGVGGFLAHRPRRGAADPWVADPGFLHGAAGTALALLAACSPVEPAWDRALLVDLPSPA